MATAPENYDGNFDIDYPNGQLILVPEEPKKIKFIDENGALIETESFIDLDIYEQVGISGEYPVYRRK